MIMPATNNAPLPLAVPLPRYAQLLGIDERAFFGMDCGCAGCGVWGDAQRAQIAGALWQSQLYIEQVLGYPLGRRWFSEPPQPVAGNIAIGQWGNAIAAGVPLRTVLGTALPISAPASSTGTGTVTVTVPVGLDDPAEIIIFAAGTTIPVYPSDVKIASGTATITIPAARLIRPNVDCPRTVWTCDDPAAYIQHVDVRWERNDPTQQGEIIYKNNCLCTSGGCACGVQRGTICAVLDDPALGIWRYQPAQWDTGRGCMVALPCVGVPKSVALRYMAGSPPDSAAEIAIVGLAHTLLYRPPCACNRGQEQWAYDRELLQNVRAGGRNPTWGFQRGAFAAWEWAFRTRIVRGVWI